MVAVGSSAALRSHVGIVLVTSPARSHPSTSLTWGALGSTSLLRGFDQCPICIVCDGYRTPFELEPDHASRVEVRLARDPCALSKRGIVAPQIADGYEEYKSRLAHEIRQRGLHGRIAVEDLASHHGFALCVRHGLHECQRLGKRFALVLQHDRAFIRRVPQADVDLLLRKLDGDAATRYIGFASSTSKLQATRLAPKYKLGRLLTYRSHELRKGLMLASAPRSSPSRPPPVLAACVVTTRPCVVITPVCPAPVHFLV
jgi:hypothetical protein